jgi:hypothetical protein
MVREMIRNYEPGLFRPSSRPVRSGIEFVGVALLATAFLAACATTGGAPSWVSGAPADTADTVYFVSAGSDPAGDPAVAEAGASRLLVSEITKYIGVTISSETTVEAQATLDEYEARVTESIRERSSAMLTGFRVVDRYLERTASGTVFVYLLGAYDRDELEREKTRFAELFAERIAAISVPEEEANRLLAEGRPVRAAERYLEAAAAALTSDVDNATVRFERSIGGAREALASVRVEAVSAPRSTTAGTAFDERFVVSVSGPKGPLEAVPLLVTYRVSRGEGRLSVRTASVLTDSNGKIAFDHPIPTASGDRELIVSLDLTASLEALSSARDKARDLVDSVEDLVNARRVTFTYRIVSLSSSIPTAIFVTDLDIDGKMLPGGKAASAIAEKLTSAGFSVGIVEEASRAAAGYERILSGSARIVSVGESDGSHLVKVDGSVTVTDRESGKTVYSSNVSRTVRSRSSAGSLDAAFTAAGEALGEALAAELP